RLPVGMNKEIERQSQEESLQTQGHPLGMHLCVDPKDVVCITGTSGSTGSPTFTYLYTEDDLKVCEEVWRRMFAWMGVKPKDRVLHGFGLSMWALGAPLVHSLIRLGHGVVPAGAEAGAERILRLAESFRPQVLMGT